MEEWICFGTGITTTTTPTIITANTTTTSTTTDTTDSNTNTDTQQETLGKKKDRMTPMGEPPIKTSKMPGS